MDERIRKGWISALMKQCAPHLTGHRLPIDVRVADMPDDLGKLLDIGLEEHFRGC